MRLLNLFQRIKSLVKFSMKSKEDRNYSDSVNTKSALRLGSSNFAREKTLQLSLNEFFWSIRLLQAS